ncbi:MAG TPA: restriction endonuclease subunit R, partial [Anaerolineae bacterium]
IETTPRTVSAYAAAVDLAAVYRLDIWPILDELRRLYLDAEVPTVHLPELARQIEALYSNYTIQAETVERALALVKPEGFDKSIDADGTEVYTAEISYPIDKEHLLVRLERLVNQNPRGFGFHYNPYNFDSNPEFSFFEQLLAHINVQPAQVEDIYFTGALTSAGKTDFYVEYLGTDERWHAYTPDFIIRRKDGKCYIVEIKSDRQRDDLIDGERGRKAVAMQKWSGLNPDRLKYEMIFTATDTLAHNQTQPARNFVAGSEP